LKIFIFAAAGGTTTLPIRPFASSLVPQEATDRTILLGPGTQRLGGFAESGILAVLIEPGKEKHFQDTPPQKSGAPDLPISPGVRR